jgi:hypothetical protein
VAGIARITRGDEARDFLYIGDGADNTVKRFDARTGEYLGIFVTQKSSGTQPGEPINGPRGLIFDDQEEELLLANQNLGQAQNGTILRYDRETGGFLGALVNFGDPNSPVAPRGMILGELLLVASDVHSKKFHVFVPPGAPLGQPWYLTFGKTDPATLDYQKHGEESDD